MADVTGRDCDSLVAPRGISLEFTPWRVDLPAVPEGKPERPAQPFSPDVFGLNVEFRHRAPSLENYCREKRWLVPYAMLAVTQRPCIDADQGRLTTKSRFQRERGESHTLGVVIVAEIGS